MATFHVTVNPERFYDSDGQLYYLTSDGRSFELGETSWSEVDMGDDGFPAGAENIPDACVEEWMIRSAAAALVGSGFVPFAKSGA